MLFPPFLFRSRISETSKTQECPGGIDYTCHAFSKRGDLDNSIPPLLVFWVILRRWIYFWSNYSDLTRPHPKWWFSKGNPLISGKPRLVKYYNLARFTSTWCFLRLSSPNISGTYNGGTKTYINNSCMDTAYGRENPTPK